MNHDSDQFTKTARQNEENGGGAETIPPPRVPDHEMLRVIGRGGYGEVWLARNTTTGVLRAAKVIRRSAFTDEKPYEREFRGIQEFEPVSRAHEGLIYILHVGQNDSEGYFYYLMELADDATRQAERSNSELQNSNRIRTAASTPQPPSGACPSSNLSSYHPRTLATEIARQGRLPIEECLRVGSSVASALEHLHRNGLVHRDVKPSNIIFVKNEPKLADIGLVAQVDEARSQVGTPGFVPLHGAGTPPADLYALGKAIYEASTGKGVRKYPEQPTALISLPDQTPRAELNQVVLKACEEDPKQRYRSAAEFRADLLLLESGRSLVRLRRNERYVIAAKRTGLAVFALVAVGVVIWRMEVSAAETRERRRHQESLVQTALLERLQSHRAMWSTNSLSLLHEAVMLEPDPFRTADLRDQAVATFFGLDARQRGFVTNQAAWKLAVAPSGETMLIAGRTNLGEWDGRGTSVHPLPVPGALNVAYRPDGSAVALTLKDASFALLDAHTGTVIKEIALPEAAKPTDDPTSIPTTFSLDASFAAAAITLVDEKPFLAVWRIDTGQTVLTDRVKVTALAFSPDNALLALGGPDGQVHIIDLGTGKALAAFDTDRTAVLGLAFQRSPFRRERNGPGPQFLLGAGTAGSGIFLWDLATYTLQREFPGSQWDVSALAFSADASLLFSTGREQVRIWDTATGRQVLEVPVESFVRGLALFPDDRRMAIIDYSWHHVYSARLFELDYGRDTQTLRGLSAEVIKVKISPDGRLLAGLAQNWQIGIWDWPDGRLRYILEGPVGETADNAALAFSNDGAYFAVSAGRQGMLWNLATGQKEREWPLPPGLVDQLAFNDAGGLRSLRLENADAKSQVHSQGRFGQVLNDIMRLRELGGENQPRLIKEIGDFNSSVYGAASVDHGKLFVVEGNSVDSLSTNRLLEFFDAATGQTVRSQQLFKEEDAEYIPTDPDGILLGYCPSNGYTPQYIMEARSGTIVGTLAHGAFALAPGLAHSLLSQSGNLTLVGASLDKPLCSLPIGVTGPNAAAFDPTGQWAFWGNTDGTISACRIPGLRQRLADCGLGW